MTTTETTKEKLIKEYENRAETEALIINQLRKRISEIRSNYTGNGVYNKMFGDSDYIEMNTDLRISEGKRQNYIQFIKDLETL